MVSRFFKKQSKRSSAKRERKISKNVHAHDRKIRRDLKANPIKKAFKRRKDPGIPNEMPFKDAVLKEIALVRAQDKKIKLENREQAKRAKTVEALQDDAQKREKEFYDRMGDRGVSEGQIRELMEPRDDSLNAYAKHVNGVLQDADVILEVIDARDPMGTRSKQVEQQIIQSGNKKLVLILNKIDLVPKENALQWLRILRRELPTVAFKCSTNLRQRNAAQLHVASKREIRSARCVGVDVLRKILGNYSEKSSETPKAVLIGVVGMPNVGKSSVINSLMRRACCPTGPVPGMTTTRNEVRLDKYLRLLDSPGVIYPTNNETGSAKDATTDAILRNARKITDISDLTAPVKRIMQLTSRARLSVLYKITAEFHTLDQFLALLAKRFGLVKKGGIVDTNRAARRVVEDWNSGRIAHYVQPQADASEQERIANLDTKVLTEMSKPFNIESCFQEMEDEINGMPSLPTERLVDVPSLSRTDADAEMPVSEDEAAADIDMNADEKPSKKDKKRGGIVKKKQPQPGVRTSTRQRRQPDAGNKQVDDASDAEGDAVPDKSKTTKPTDSDNDDEEMFSELAGNAQHGQANKRRDKRRRKIKQKVAVKTDQLADVLMRAL